MSLREAFARIIDPETFADRDRVAAECPQYLGTYSGQSKIDSALAKADLILAYQPGLDDLDQTDLAAMSKVLDALDEAPPERPRKPRLTTQIIEAAAVGHYGKKGKRWVSIEGLDLTVDGINWSFRDAFTRMWHAAWAEIERMEGKQ